MLISMALMACSGDGKDEGPNMPPTVEIVSHADGDELEEGAQLLIGLAEDPEGDAIAVQWRLDDAIVCESEAAGSTSCEMILLPGSAWITLYATDASGNAVSDTIELVVAASPAPDITWQEPSGDARYYTDLPVPMAVQIGETEDDLASLLLTWSSSLDGDLALPQALDSTGAASGEVLLSAGEHLLEVGVENPAGRVTTASTLVMIGPINSAPACSFSSPENGDVLAPGSPVFFVAAANDIDQGPDDLLRSQAMWTGLLARQRHPVARPRSRRASVRDCTRSPSR